MKDSLSDTVLLATVWIMTLCDGMRISVQIPEMDRSFKILILVFLITYTNCVSVLDVPQPDNLLMNMWDGEVMAVWDPPMDAPPKSHYNVQMAKYGHDWAKVSSCTRITVTYCDLSHLIHNYAAAYKVRVQLVTGDDVSVWRTTNKFYPNKSELLAPSFTLLATSSSLIVKVHKKPILTKLFPYDMTYTIYLDEKGRDNKTTIAYLNDGVEEYQGTKTFYSLHWGREYCVSLRVEGNGALSRSDVSAEQCLVLPEQEWFIIAVSSLSILGMMAIVAVLLTILFCYLQRPEKIPVALKSPRSGWLPLPVREGPMEVVTDKGWFLTISRTEVKSRVAKEPVTPHAMVSKVDAQEGRRTSMDSGVSMESNSATANRGSAPMRQEDSGCGSMGGSESSTSCSSSPGEHPLQEGRSNTARQREDSGVGLGCQLDCSMSLDGQDSGPVAEPVAGDNYRSQSPSAVQIHVCDGEEIFKQILTDPDTVLADVVTGYRAVHQSCICSGAGQCAWCNKTEHYGTEDIRQYRATCIENGLLNSKNHFVDTCKEELTFSSYCRKTHIHTDTVVMMDDSETWPNLPLVQLEAFPLLTALSTLPIVEGGQDFGMNNMSLSLCDVELQTD
uniref:interleukin-10 receptor subunit alpha n=1 Tax=Centroberyx gerrardi TaxID=166262 RepID=UPI003AAAC818